MLVWHTGENNFITPKIVGITAKLFIVSIKKQKKAKGVSPSLFEIVEEPSWGVAFPVRVTLQSWLS